MQSRKGFLSLDWASIKEFFFLLLVVFLIRTFGFGLYQVPTGSMETTMLVGERFFADKFTILFSKPKHGDIISFNDPLYNYSKNPLKRLWQEYVWGPSNWTKRVIGVPGDEIRGVVEDGKPVIYRNGQKLDEPYLNKYPLILVYSEDLAALIPKLRREQRAALQGRAISAEYAQLFLSEQLDHSIHPQSYDPLKPYNQQPFYRIKPNRVEKDEQGRPVLKYPQTPIYYEQGGEIKCRDEFYIKLGPDEYWAMGDNRLGSNDCRFFGPLKERFIHGKIIFRIWSIDSDESWWIVDLIKHPIDFFKRIRWSRFFQCVN